jgi:hypothetical protein
MSIEAGDKVYGPKHAPRVKWKCRCTKRNDHPVMLPAGKNNVYVCRHCKRATILSFSEAAAETVQNAPGATPF